MITIAILGLDNAGKTTTAKMLERTSFDTVAPTIGFAQYNIRFNNETIQLYDLGGRESFRDAWRHYYDDCYGFIYVIDSSELHRFDENRQVLYQLLDHEKVRNKPLLILANKQDKNDALDINTIIENLGIKNFLNTNRHIVRMAVCTTRLVKRNRKSIQIDPAIQNGFGWLMATIYGNYDVLRNRVRHDIQMRNENLQKERRIQQQQQEEEHNHDLDDDIITTAF